VDSNRAPEDAELADVLDSLGKPEAITLDEIAAQAVIQSTERGFQTSDFGNWINDRKNRRIVPHRLEKCGYVPVRNDTAQDGLWKIRGRRQTVYARVELSESSKLRAAGKLAGQR
jgi:hypothetical protein